ncbi:MAG: hypothetical protein ACFFCZ_19345 [Promethearchaeota archaeon]
MVRIVATPFVLSELEQSDAKERNAIEIALAFIEIEEKRNKKAELLDFISRFYIPFYIVPLDAKRGLVLGDPTVFSGTILLQDMSRVADPVGELGSGKAPDLVEYGQKLVLYLRTLISAYTDRKRKFKIEGLLDDRTMTEFIPFISAVRLVKNVPYSKVIPGGKELEPDFPERSSLKYYPSEAFLQETVKQHRALISIIENYLDQVEKEIKALENEFRSKKRELEEKLRQGIARAEEVRDKILRQQDERLRTGPRQDFPTPGDMLNTYLKRIEQAFREITAAAQKKSVDLTFKVCRDARNQLRDASDFILGFEDELAKYKRAIEELERDCLREKKRANNECEDEKRRLEGETHKILDDIRTRIEALSNLIQKVEEARDRVNTEHNKWSEVLQQEIEDTTELVVPLEYFDHEPGVPFRLYLTIYFVQYLLKNRKRTRRVFFEPISLTVRGRKRMIKQQPGLKIFVDGIQKRLLSAKKDFTAQLDEIVEDDRINDLKRQVIANAFSYGMKLLVEKKIIDPKTARRINNAYDEHFKLIIPKR